MSLPDFNDDEFYPKDSAVCGQCQRGDHDDCAIITWSHGTCQCGSCGLVSEPRGDLEAKE